MCVTISITNTRALVLVVDVGDGSSTRSEQIRETECKNMICFSKIYEIWPTKTSGQKLLYLEGTQGPVLS